MILIADAGGTKTDWRLLDGQKIEQFRTEGFNPHTHSLEEYANAVKLAFSEISNDVKKVYFYGASIYSDNRKFTSAIAAIFPSAEITANNDLLGTCRALSDDQPGFVGILGTGSAGCFYNGEDIVYHIPSLGFALGDEGSGAILGKRLLQAIFRKKFDATIQNAFDTQYGIKKEDAYANVYAGDQPNTYLASFTTFLNDHREHADVRELLTKEFRRYFNAYFLSLAGTDIYPFHFSGSIAFHFQNELREIAAELGLSVGRIFQAPIAGLALYHQNHG